LVTIWVNIGFFTSVVGVNRSFKGFSSRDKFSGPLEGKNGVFPLLTQLLVKNGPFKRGLRAFLGEIRGGIL